MPDGLRSPVITIVDDYRRRRLAARGADLLRRRHCVVVSTDDRSLLDTLQASARAGHALRRDTAIRGAKGITPLTVSVMTTADRDALAAVHPRIATRGYSAVVAGRTRADLNAALLVIRSGHALVAEAAKPSTAIAPATVVLTDAERRRLSAGHSELRRTRAAVAVALPAADLLLTHVHRPEANAVAAAANAIAVELTRDELRRLRADHRELRQHEKVILFAGDELIAPVQSARLMQALTRFRQHTASVSWRQLPQPATPAILVKIVADRAAVRRKTELLTAAEVGRRAGSRQANPARLAQQWKAQGRVFAYRDKGEILYPAFQFDAAGRPRPEIARVIASTHPVLRGGVSSALWFVSPNRHLAGRTPLAALDDCGAVERAAGERMVEHRRQIARRATVARNRREDRGVA